MADVPHNEIILYYCIPKKLFRVIVRNCDFRFKEYEKTFYILPYILNLKKWV